MINVLYLIGPSNSGKDYFKNLMIKNFGFVPIIPFTTRPKRKGEVDGVDYYFFDDLSDINTKEDDIVEMRSYNMVNNDSISTTIVYYGVSINPDELDKTKDYIMCGTLESYANLNKAVMDDFNGRYAKGKKQTFPSVKIIPIFIETDSDTRYHKAMGRAMETGENIYEIQKRFDADSEDFSFKNRIKFPALYEIYNSYDPDMNDALTSVINNIYQNHKFVDPTEKEELPSLTALDYPVIKLDNTVCGINDSMYKHLTELKDNNNLKNAVIEIDREKYKYSGEICDLNAPPMHSSIFTFKKTNIDDLPDMYHCIFINPRKE